MSRETVQLVGVWALLMVLLALTFGATFAPLGGAKPFVNLGIAFAKAGLIFWVFMHLREQGWLARLAATAALAWLAILMVMTHADLATRSLFGA